MKKRLFYFIASSFVLILACVNQADAQKKLRVGGKEILFQSPMTISEVSSDDSTVIIVETIPSEEKTVKKRHYHYYSHTFQEVYFGMGLAVNSGNETFTPVYYGESYDLQTGFRWFYRPCRWYAIGTQLQYSFYSYKLDGAAAADRFEKDVPGKIQAEYFRSNNLGTAIINRFYLFHSVYLEAGAYADVTTGKSYKVRTILEKGDDVDKLKYYDSRKYTPIQAGLQGAIGLGEVSIYAKYRLTNMFNPDILPNDPPRLHLGIMVTF